jgi:hypothetical protein
MPFGFGNGQESQGAPVDIAAMTEPFLAALPADAGANRAGASNWQASDTRKLLGDDDPAFSALMTIAQTSHGKGILRFLLPASKPPLAAWNKKEGWHSDWPSLPAGIAFASDWRGNLLVLDPKPASAGGRCVGRLTIATSTYEVMDQNVAQFIGQTLPAQWQTLLSKHLFDKWLASGGKRPAPEECVDCETLVVLGGDPNATDNLEITDLVVAVSVAGQVYERVRRLPPGTKIGAVKIE